MRLVQPVRSGLQDRMERPDRSANEEPLDLAALKVNRDKEAQLVREANLVCKVRLVRSDLPDHREIPAQKETLANAAAMVLRVRWENAARRVKPD